MVVNTITELNTLLNQVDIDATVLAAISNDAVGATGSGLSAGYVTTRLGSEVKNVQKVISDIENDILAGIRMNIQEEGTTVVAGPGDLNFVGTGLTVTDVGGVATVTLSGSMTANGTPVNNQLGVWTGADTMEGDVDLTWDGTTLAVTGAITATERVIGLNTRSTDYVYIFVDGATGVANPVDPEGASDPFDTIANAITWAETTYVGINSLDLEVAAGTYNIGANLTPPVNCTTFTLYGAGIGTTILNFDRCLGGNNQLAMFYNMTVNTGVASPAPGGNTQVGILYLYDVTWNTTSRIFTGGGSIVNWGYSGSVIQNSTINATWDSASSRILYYCSGNLRLNGPVTTSVTNSVTNNGTNGNDIIRVDGGVLSAEDSATLNIQDELASTPVAGRINLVYGASYAEGTSVTVTNGTFIKTDATGVTRKDLRPEIVSITSSRALLITDETDILEVNTNGGAVAITIPTNATVAFPIGTIINFTLVDITAAATIVGAGGVTVNGVVASTGTFDGALWDLVTMYKRGTDEWVVNGNIGTFA